jgi:hypothetical protein
MSDLVGQIIGQYRVEEEIGRGYGDRLPRLG